MTKKEFKPTPDMISAAKSVFQAMTLVQTIEPIVKGCQKKILEKHKFKVSEEWLKHERIGGRVKNGIITDLDDVFMMKEDDFNIYLKELHVEHKKHGFEVKKIGNCPYLEADYILTKAKTLLCLVMEPVTNITKDQVLNCGLDEYYEYIDLCLKLLAPFVN